MRGRSVVDIGMEILRAEGVLDDLTVVATQLAEPDDEEDDVEEDEEDVDPLKVVAEITDRLSALAEQLAVRQTLDLLATQVSRLTELVVQLQMYVTQPRIKVPVRDEAGRIVEVREVMDSQGPQDVD